MVLITVGVCAYNEGNNIFRCLESIVDQSTEHHICEVIAVSGGSTDDTDQIVSDFSERDGRVLLVRQEERQGKSAAVNEVIARAKGEVIVLVNADNQLMEGSFSQLLEPLSDPSVGMVGGRPVPTNSWDGVAGFATNLLWDMHHRVSLRTPKTGELIAFRNLDFRIPEGVNTDEDWIRMEMENRGYRVVYAPGAMVVNKGPDTISDFLSQRIRVNIGEKYMKKRFDFQVPTWENHLVFQSFVESIRETGGPLHKIVLAASLELLSRAYASLHVTLGREDPYIWRMVESTKSLD
ncbi:MAG: glycosyltransferase [Methanomassiliicoccales archaeon]